MKQFKTWAVLVLGMFTFACSEDDYVPTPNGSLPMQMGMAVKENGEIQIQTRGTEVAPLPQKFKMRCDNGAVLNGFAATTNYIVPHYTVEKREDVVMTGDNAGAEASRGQVATTAEFHSDYGLIAFQYPSSQSFTTSGSTMLPRVKNEQVLRSRGWMTKEYWPGPEYKLTFFAYAPYSGTINGLGYSGNLTITDENTHLGEPEFDYCVPYDVPRQKDLLVCADTVDVRGDYNMIRTLHFRHALSCIQIVVGDQMAPCKVTQIQISGVYGRGHYKYADDEWSQVDKDAAGNARTERWTYTLTPSPAIQIFATDQNRVINDGEYSFFCMPQTVPQDAKLKIWINDGQEHVLESDLAGHIWEKGCTISYFLATADTKGTYILETSTPGTFDINTERWSDWIYVKSYHQTYYGSVNAIPWEADYQLDGDTTHYQVAKGYVTNLQSYFGQGDNKLYGNGTSSFNDQNIIRAYMLAQTPLDTCSVDNEHTQKLRAATPKSGYDLSTYKGTANCYVVNAPGTYKFPLVYGNGLDENGDVTAAINAGDTYRDYQGEVIETPYIYDKYDTHDACIVWQDAPGLIKPASVVVSTPNSDGRSTYLEFEVPQETICQGNAVVAVRDHSGVILWSWHIWVTDYDISTTISPTATLGIRNRDDISRYMSQKPLGWCDAVRRYCKPRKTTFNFRQISQETNEVTATASVSISQTEGYLDFPLRCTYYQWGRKDAMPPCHRDYSYHCTPLYDNRDESNSYAYNFEPYSAGYLNDHYWEAIAHPNYFYCSSQHFWSSDGAHIHYDLWDIGCTDNSYKNEMTKKTVYDPSPPGFVVPPSLTYTGMTRNGTNQGGGDMFVTGNWGREPVKGKDRAGWLISLSGGQSGFYTYFPAFGHRSYHYQDVREWDVNGYYWTAQLVNTWYGRSFTLNSGGLYPRQEGVSASEACTVWPVVQQ